MSKSFKLENIRLSNFRNYDLFCLENLSNMNIFVGPNAVGKTNLIEAIQLLTQNSSFRHPHNSDLLNKNNKHKTAVVEGKFSDNYKEEDTNLVSNNKLVVSFTESKKTYLLNGKNKTIAQCKGNYPSVIFTPDDLALVKGGNSLRRRILDLLGGQLSAEFYTVYKDFNRIFKQKNSTLKEGNNKDLVKSINEIFVVAGAQLSYFRKGLADKIRPILKDFYKKISGSDELLDLEFVPSWADGACDFSRDEARTKLFEYVNNHLDAEIASGRSLVGPQKDKLLFYLNNQDASNFASQGQQRSIVLAYKLAEVEMIKRMLDKKPILLLDDVMSELDKQRRNELLNFINKKTQVFITTTNLDYFDKDFINNVNVIELRKDE